MPFLAFANDKLYSKLSKINANSNIIEEYPEQEFLASCLRVGLTTNDLEKFTYIEVMKILYSFLEKKEQKVKATKSDIDNFLR